MIYAPIKPPIVLRRLTPIQRQYHHDMQHRFFVLPPGRRSRKTLISMRKVQYAAMRTPGGRYFHGAPTWSQAKDIFWERLKRNTRPFWSKAPSESELAVYLRNGAEIHVEGLDKAERVEGQPWHGCHITEFPNTKPDAWPAHIRPVLSDTLGFAILDGVPEGRNHFYDLALYACNGIIPETRPYDGAFADNGDWCYYHWFSSDVLTASEIEEARRNLDERTFRQEYEGQFLSYEGVLYYNFDRQRNVSESLAKYNPLCPLFLSTDFNKTPMVWVVGQLDGRIGRIVDELEISFNAKTQATAQLFCERYANHQARTVYVTGDASGQHESIRDFTSDYVIIDDVLRSNGWRVVMDVPPANPNVNNRVNLACSLLHTITGNVRLFINPSCARLINDYERNTSDGKGGKEKKDQYQTHASDAADYLVWKWFANEFYHNGIVQQ